MFSQRNSFVAILALILTRADGASPRLKLIVLCAIFLSLLPLAQVSAADINVDATCSLTQAINAANATANADTGSCETADSGADSIKLPANGKTVLTAELPHITTNMTIETSGEGSRHIIDGDRKYSIMVVNGPGLISVTLKDLVMTRGEGGGVITRENLTINNSVISNINDNVESGAGIWQEGGAVTINNSVINGNKTASTGGGISSRSGTLTIKNSVISNNQAEESGGIELHGSTTAIISNSTIYGNRAKQSGGGISGAALTGSATLTHVTIVNNRASTGGGIYKGSSGTWKVRNSIIANNRGGDCVGPLTENIKNIIKDGSCGTNPDLSVDPMLAPPQSASPTFFPLYIGSPAIDAGLKAYCLSTDQRGMARPSDEPCDLGAYEGSVIPPPPVREPDDGEPNLRPETVNDPDGGETNPRPAPVIEPDYGGEPNPRTCETLPESFRVKATGGKPQCQRVGAVGIGSPELAARFIDAVDVWSWVLPNTEVCFGVSGGTFKFIDTTPIPRVVYDLPAYSDKGMTCTTINRPGIVVLMPGPPAEQRRVAVVVRPTPASQRSLQSCMVTTRNMIRFRDAPRGAPLVYTDPWGRQENGWLPSTVTLTALARTVNWFKVDYYGAQGWVEARFVIPRGNCR